MATLLVVRTASVTVACVCAVLAVGGCGEQNTDADERAAAQAVVERFGTAFAARDGATICKELFAPDLIRAVEGVGLGCQAAMRQAAADVKDPELEVLSTSVRGDIGYSTVRSTAQGQEPSVDRITLKRTDDGWRITALNTEDELSPEEKPKVSPPVTIGRTTPTVIDRTTTVEPKTQTKP
jgi:ketosteroid isomerase-like protein